MFSYRYTHDIYVAEKLFFAVTMKLRINPDMTFQPVNFYFPYLISDKWLIVTCKSTRNMKSQSGQIISFLQLNKSIYQLIEPILITEPAEISDGRPY